MGSRARWGGLLIAAALGSVSCGQRAAPKPSESATPVSSATPNASASGASSATASSQSPPSAAPSTSASGLPAPDFAAAEGPAAPPVANFAKPDKKACKTFSVDVAQYQQRGDFAIAARADRIAATWLVQLPGRKQLQVAFATFEADAKQSARARGVGLSEPTSPRAFAVGAEWTISWFDERGFAYTRPHDDPVKSPDVQHLTAVGPGEDEEVSITNAPGDVLIAAAVLPSAKEQIALFQFAPSDPAAPAVKALSVTHQAKAPHHPAVTADKSGITVAWLEAGGRIVASHFDDAGKEKGAPCTLAPEASAKRERLSLSSSKAGAVAVWQEGETVRVRGVDASGCASSPLYELGAGTWPRAVAAPSGEVVVTWVGKEGKLLAAKLGDKGAPPSKGFAISESSGGVKDPPSVAVAGSRVAFAWTEAMGPTIATKRLILRTFELSCL